ncbi:MAG: hypothetical protein M3P43_05685 [Actinomycetota bacterium]|nr:hypothetical protein [Actinomycetota bacterium]
MMDPDEEWNTWVEWLGEEPGGRHIWREVTDILVRREVWDSFAIVYNVAIHNGGPREITENPNFPIWIKNNYLDAQVMAVRRQLDMRHDVISLRRLLEHVGRYPQVLSRDRYAARTAGRAVGKPTSSLIRWSG